MRGAGANDAASAIQAAQPNALEVAGQAVELPANLPAMKPTFARSGNAGNGKLEHNLIDLNRKSIGWDSQSPADRRVSSG